MDHSLVMERALHNSMKLGTMPFMATQDEQVIVKSSDKCGPSEKEMATQSSIIVGEFHEQYGKRQKYVMKKMSLSR